MNLWSQLFGNDAPVEIEIGPERGTFLFATADLHPERNYVGIERSTPRVRRLQQSLLDTPRPNVQVIAGDAACVIAGCVPAASVAAYHIYFPDPWWKRRHYHRRLLTREFSEALARTLEPGGAIHLETDVEELYRFAIGNLAAVASLRVAPTLPARPVLTAFEVKALSRGDRIFAASLLKSSDATSAPIDVRPAQALG